jgi:hypothetical protein
MPALVDAGSAGAAGGSAAREAGEEVASETEPSPEAGQNDVVVEAGDIVDDSAGGDGPLSCSPYITNVTRADYGPGAGFGQNAVPRVVQGPPSGGGCCKGSLSVLSLGEGGSIVVELGQTIIDGPGADFIVFENAFSIGADPNNPFAEPATVEVSADGVTWTGFPCTAGAFPYGHCAGWHPVLANPATNQIDPTDPAVAGGDAFDLGDLPGDAGISEVRYLRITDRADLSGDFDLDAVAVVHGRCR